jgi:hypothetical protein
MNGRSVMIAEGGGRPVLFKLNHPPPQIDLSPISHVSPNPQPQPSNRQTSQCPEPQAPQSGIEHQAGIMPTKRDSRPSSVNHRKDAGFPVFDAEPFTIDPSSESPSESRSHPRSQLQSQLQSEPEWAFCLVILAPEMAPFVGYRSMVEKGCSGEVRVAPVCLTWLCRVVEKGCSGVAASGSHFV